ncbi:MAG: hypothetical protein HGB35_06880, partial [Geobacteraceae bacterium]|nr:hypothetical protein [Geobacteraceae bacterium]
MAVGAKNNIVLCSDPILAEILEKRGIKARVFDTILSVGEQEAAMKLLDEFAAQWFLDEDGNDYTLYRKVSIGAAIYQETLSFFHLLTHFVFIVEKLVRDHDCIEMYQSVSCRMPQHILDFLATNKIPVHTVDEQYPYL